MSELEDLYQDLILDHGHKRPRNYRSIDDAQLVSRGHNPVCGDQLTIFLKLAGDRVEDVAFQGEGCAISKASASLMTEAVKRKSRDEALALFRSFHDLVTGSGAEGAELGKLAVFSNVSKFPIRVKCAMLAWRTLESALAGQAGDIVTTE
ncbi:MAG: SUF system NifU family Fe-S cluster assembly protein [Candidatus Sericytochromatia bacterium]|nr:SUF system NifU family Fe-S cluster assembly protein [Candidatus Tanganyikabacteria bacterium]